MEKTKRKNDILLILSLLLAGGLAWGILRLVCSPGGEAVITVKGAVIAVLPLDADASCPIQPGGDFENTVVVKDGRVRVQDANCPDGLCVRQGWISRDGEQIVCLPHGLIVAVRGGAKNTMDAVAGG